MIGQRIRVIDGAWEGLTGVVNSYKHYDEHGLTFICDATGEQIWCFIENVELCENGDKVKELENKIQELERQLAIEKFRRRRLQWELNDEEAGEHNE